MSYLATVYNVMISAPSDVEEECKVAHDVVHAWNFDNAEHMKKILLPVNWKNSTVPEAGTPAQKSINKQLVDKVDILVAIFKHRLGTPTKNAISGTVEEIQEVLEAKKPVLLYFSEESVPQRESEGAQWKELCKFKRDCQPNDYYHAFTTTLDFKTMLSSHIAKIAHTLLPLQQNSTRIAAVVIFYLN